MPTLRTIISRVLEIPVEDLELPTSWSEDADKKLHLAITFDDGTDEQLVSDHLNILLDILMEKRGYTVDSADLLVREVWKNLVEDTR